MELFFNSALRARGWARVAAATAFLCGASAAFADDVLHIPTATRRPVLADYVDGVPADAGVEISELRQNQPGDGEPASHKTRVFLSHDDAYFYAVYVCTDDPALIRARIPRRDDLIGDDAVDLLIDTFHDRQRAYHFYVNPYGAQMDGMETEGLDTDIDFDARYESEGRRTPTGWVAMMAIPYKSLRFRVGDTQDWGIAVGRIVARDGEFDYWPFISQSKEGFITQFAEAKLDSRIEPGRNLQLIPYIYIPRTKTLDIDDPNHPAWLRDHKPEAGLDAKVVIDNAFVADVTINPDFSEVESDDPQVLINQRYQVLFPEKRPIFLENSSFFKTPELLFYSRAVADPNVGARVTGHKDDITVGGLLIDDVAPGKLIPQGEPDAGKTAAIGVVRVQKDLDAGSYLATFLSDWKLGDKRNLVASLDGRAKLGTNWAISGQVASSASDDDGAGSSGYLGVLNLARADRDLNYVGQFLDISRNFAANLGYVPRVDILQTTQNLSYLWIDDDNDGRWLRSQGPKLKAVGTWDHEHVQQDWSTDAAWVVNGPRNTSLQADILDGYERYQDIGFHENGWSVTATSPWYDWITPTLTFGQVGGVNYQPAAGVAPFLGKARNVSLEALLTLGPHFRVDQTWLWNDLHSYDAIAGQRAGSMVYRELLARTKLTYQYNRFYAARLIVDDDWLHTNSALNALPPTKQRNFDLLFSYTPSPGTAFYLGWSNLRENVSLVGEPPVAQLTHELNMTTGRQVFMKFSYLFE